MTNLPKSLLKFYLPEDLELQVDEVDAIEADRIAKGIDNNFMAFMAGESSKYDNYPSGQTIDSWKMNPESLAKSWGLSTEIYNKIIAKR
ncbi:MAG: hypothetical protein KA770_00335 [Shewanella sp.]|nr:hypothetical protein [Shewanella sp.]